MLGGTKLCDRFDLVFGTSTRSIIAALIALGHSVDEIHELYKDHVVKMMGKWSPWSVGAHQASRLPRRRAQLIRLFSGLASRLAPR